MGKKESKRWDRFISMPADYTIHEMFTLLESIGHRLSHRRGSAVTFTNEKGEQHVHFHLPHPERTFKRKTLKSIYDQLASHNLLKKNYKIITL
jgi:predicted RNA binding protein YcfA (HicA-like mRNA interferase family)